MSLRAQIVGAVLAACALALPARAENPRDAADLFPAQTLAYLEFRQPARLSREVAALFRGSVLDDMPAWLAKYRDKRGDNNRFFFEDLIIGYFSMFASPEMVAEFGRLQGGAVALTGFGKDMEPEIVGVILSGTSNGPTFIMRTILTVDPDMRRIEECEGIALYREKRADFRRPVAKGGPPPVAEPRGPTCALLPDGIIVGSTPDSVKLMIRRLKGKIGDPALSSVAAFRDTAKLRDKPGLFGYADLGALHLQLDEAMKNAGAPAQLEWGRINSLLNLKAGRQATVSFTLQNGSLELNARIGLDTAERSPLVDLLPDKKADPEALHFVPKDAGIALAVALPEGEKRWNKVLALAELLEKADGKRGPAARKQIAELEKNLQLAFGKDVFAKLAGAVIVLDPLSLTAHLNPLKLIVLSATDADAAKALEEDVLPKLGGLLGQEKPKVETIAGQKIGSLPVAALGPGKRVYYGRHGKTLVLGENGQEVAEALTGGAKKVGHLSDAKTAAALKETGEASVVGVIQLSSLLPALLPEESGMRRFAVPVAPGGAPAAPPKPAAVDPRRVKLAKALAKVTASLPPATVTLERKPEQITLVIRQPNLKSVSAKIVNQLVEASLEKMYNPGGNAGEAVPAPPAKQ